MKRQDTNIEEQEAVYKAWQQQCERLSSLSYWAAMFFLTFHPLVMVGAYDLWADWNPLLVLHSA